MTLRTREVERVWANTAILNPENVDDAEWIVAHPHDALVTATVLRVAFHTLGIVETPHTRGW